MDFQNSLDELKQAIDTAPKQILITADYLGGLFVVEVKSPKFLQIRDQMRTHVKSFRDVLMPQTEEVCDDLKTFFRTFRALTFEEWEKDIFSSLDEIYALKDKVSTLCRSYDKLSSEVNGVIPKTNALKNDLIEREDTAMISYEAHKKHRNNLYIAAAVITPIPFVGWVVGPILAASGKICDSISKDSFEDAKIAEDAISKINSNILPSINNFSIVLNAIDGFFLSIEKDIKNGLLTKSKLKLKNHFLLMKDSSNEIMQKCDKFVGFIPLIKSEFKKIKL